MAKITLDNISSGFQSTSQVNSNYDKIEDDLNNKVLYRNNPAGEPNQMLNDLDMNSKDVLNAKAVDVQSLSIAGTPVIPSGAVAGEIPVQSGNADRFLTTNGTTTSWAHVDIREFDTVASMVGSATLVVGQVVRTLGYLAKGDGGDNLYDVVAAATGTDDGGTFIDLATHQAQGMFPNGTINVKQFGAVGDGVADDVAKFQAAIDSTTDGTIAVIHIPTGNYEGDFSTLTVGTRTVVFDEEKDVSYTTTAPTINRKNAKFGADITRPWFIGHNGFIDNTTDGTGSDRPTLRSQRVADHTGGVVTTNASAISAQTTINQTSGRVDNFENAYVGQVDSYRNDTVTGAPNITVYQGTCFKHNPSTGGFFGANFVARDQTTRASSVSKGGLVGTEVDVVASGPDDSNLRIGLDVIARGYDTSADGATSVHAGIQVRPANTGVVSAEAVNIENAVMVTEGTLGSVTNCYSADGGATGVILTGTYTNVAIETATTGQSTVKFGSNVSAAGTANSLIALSGHNASAAKTNYAKIQSVVQVNTAGAENGRLDGIVIASGSDITGWQLSANSSANPLFVRVNSSLKQVTEGATNSGGAGFKVLRVPN